MQSGFVGTFDGCPRDELLNVIGSIAMFAPSDNPAAVDNLAHGSLNMIASRH
jgi:hypothetical protein